jgi:hypothetical protein
LNAIEGVAFVKRNLAPDDLVAGDRVALDIDPFDIDAGVSPTWNVRFITCFSASRSKLGDTSAEG